MIFQLSEFRRIVGYFALSIGLLGLAACVPSQPVSEDELAERYRFRPPHRVEHTTHTYLVPINPERLEMAEQQRRDLYDFLVGVGARPGDAVVVAARRARLDNRGDVVRFVRRLGLRPEMKLIKETEAGDVSDGYDNAILIRFELFIAEGLQCGQWGETVKTNFYNTSLKDFGCATTSALNEEIAYPSSLIRGKTLSYSGAGGSNAGSTPAAAGAAAPAGGGAAAAQ